MLLLYEKDIELSIAGHIFHSSTFASTSSSRSLIPFPFPFPFLSDNNTIFTV